MPGRKKGRGRRGFEAMIARIPALADDLMEKAAVEIKQGRHQQAAHTFRLAVFLLEGAELLEEIEFRNWDPPAAPPEHQMYGDFSRN